MLMRRGDCIGEKNICEYFREATNISKEEQADWPQYGDATYYKLKSR